MFKTFRAMVWFNFLSSVYHTLDTMIDAHNPVFSPGVDFVFHSIGLFLWGTIALYGERAVKPEQL